MREIKFRAWDKKQEQIYYSEDGLFGFDLMHDGTLTGRFDAEDGAYHLTLMQCTGLKDCQGKEIYEGDIVKQTVAMSGEYLSAKGKTGVVGKIVWFHDGWSIEQIAYHQIMVSIIEVIGNIYENPELLK